MAEEKPTFGDLLKKIQKYIEKPTLVIKADDEELLNKNFPPRYLLEMYCFTNPTLPKFTKQFHFNYDYDVHFKSTVCDVIEIIREFNKLNALYPPAFPQGKKKDTEFKKKFESLKDQFKHGIGKPEMEIFMMAIDQKEERIQDQYYTNSARDVKRLAKSSVEEMKLQRVSSYSTLKDFLVSTQLLKTNQASCSKCSLYNNNTQYIESNIPYDLNDNHVDLLMISDKPSNGLIMEKEAHDILKQFMKHYQLDTIKYVLANSVACENGSNKDDEIASCKSQLDKVIKHTSPTIIMAMGTTALQSLGLDTKGIVNRAGTRTEYNGFDVIISVHPSYVAKNKSNETFASFGSAFSEVRNTLFPPEQEASLDVGRKRPGDVIVDGQIYAAKKLPKKFYDSEWILINAFRDGFKTIDHIFRNVNTNEKVIRKVSSAEYEYYYMMKDIHGISKPSYNVSDLLCKKGPWKFSPDKDVIERYGKSVLYEGTVALETKATVDYYHHSKEESSYLPQVFRYDVEHDMGSFHGTDINAPYKITYISAEYLGEYYLWILDSDKISVDVISTYKDNKGKERKLHINEFGGNESLLLQHFWHTLFIKCDPDIITAWNGHGFDFPYLINRSKRIPYVEDTKFEFASFNSCHSVIDLFESLEKTFEVAIEDGWQQHSLTGIIVADLMLMYEAQHAGGLESTALDFIADLELNLSKKPFPASNASKEEWVAYNLWDTELLELIDNKVQATNYKFFLTKITKNTWHSVDYSMGIVDGLLLNYAKKKNIALRTSKDPGVFTNKFLESIVGGFTQTNDGGLYKLLVDYDAKSMYPSIMLSFNMGPNTLRMTIKPDDAYSIMVDNYDKKKVVEVYYNEMFCCNGMQTKSEFLTLEKIHATIKEKNYIVTPSGAIYCSIEEEKSLFFDILDELGRERDIVKGAMYNKDGSLDIAKYNKQLALKISANSFYGVYLFNKFMYFNTTIGASITMTGRVFIKAVMYMIDVKYGYLNKTLDEAMKSIVVTGQQDLFLKMAIYADTDGCVVCFQDIVDKKAPLDKQLELVEKEIKSLNVYIAQVVEGMYPFFNKGQGTRLMKFKEDWVAGKGLFYKRKHKRYAIHIVRENGKPKDELLYRGIQIRRSDSPKLIKKVLGDLVELVLRKPNIELDEVFDEISKIEDRLFKICQARDLSLAKPVKFGKSLSQYKNNPQNIECMLLWNALHKREDFKVGSKAYLYNIQRIDFDAVSKKFGLTQVEIEEIRNKFKLDAIAIPQDYEKVPDYIDINAKLTIEKRFTIPYTNILEPIIETSTISDVPLIDFL